MNYDAWKHPEDPAPMPHTEGAEVECYYSVPRSDADEWMIARGVYDARTGALLIQGNTWKGTLTDEIDPDLEDVESVDQAQVNAWLQAYHEDMLTV